MQRGHQRKFFFNSVQLLTVFSEGKMALCCEWRQRKIWKGSYLNTICFRLNFLCPPQILTLLFASQPDLRGVWKSCMVYLVFSNLFVLIQTAVWTQHASFPISRLHLRAKLVCGPRCSTSPCQLCPQDLLESDHPVCSHQIGVSMPNSPLSPQDLSTCCFLMKVFNVGAKPGHLPLVMVSLFARLIH